MPPFQYQDYRNPYGQSIAELLAHKNDAQVLGALRAGDLQQRNAEQSGALQANIFATAGQVLPAVQANARNNEEFALKRDIVQQQKERGALELDAAKRENRSRMIFEGELQNPANYGPDGTLDDTKLSDRLRKQDVGAWQQFSAITAATRKSSLEYAATLAKLKESDLTVEEKQQKARDAQAAHIGELAYSALSTLKEKPDDPLHARDTALAMASRAMADGAVSGPAAREFLTRTAAAGPQDLAETLAGFVPATMRADLDKKHADARHVTAEAANLEAEAAGGGKAGLQRAEEERHNGELERIATLREGREAAMAAESRRHNLATEGQAAATSGLAGGDVKAAVQGMIDGKIPPQLPGRASKEYTAVMAEAQRRGFDLAGAATDWAATQKHIATMNGSQQLRLNQSINALPDMLDKVDTLASQWKGGQFPILNRANLTAAKNGVYGKQVASVANQLDAQIADVVADLGNVYMGGNSPTDHALGLAGKSLSSDWDASVLHDMIGLAKGNVKIRRNSINNTGVAGASDENPYDRGRQPSVPPPATGGMIEAIDDKGNIHHAPAGTALPAGWRLK